MSTTSLTKCYGIGKIKSNDGTLTISSTKCYENDFTSICEKRLVIVNKWLEFVRDKMWWMHVVV